MSAELLTLSSGAYVHRIIKDDAGLSLSGSGENAEEVNASLDNKMGYSIRCRIVEEFFAKAPSQVLCRDFTDTARESIRKLSRSSWTLQLRSPTLMRMAKPSACS